VVDIGPGAGVHGGEVVAQGTPAEIMAPASITGDYLSGTRADRRAGTRAAPQGGSAGSVHRAPAATT
jgi:excinuclease ABC subunit A